MKINLLMAALLATISTVASATPLVVGVGSSANAFPFGGSFANPTTYQQVYSHTSFGTAAVGISALSFTLRSGTVTDGTFTLDLSTTAKAVDALDTSIFANNVGPDQKQVFTGALAGELSDHTLTFTFAPFRYDPSAGNLLLNIATSGIPNSFVGFFKADDGDAGGVYSRAHDFGSGFEGYGLQTTFEVGAAPGVPEPAAWAMMAAGFALVGVAVRRRSTVVAA